MVDFIFIFKRNEDALAPFSYLVLNNCQKTLSFIILNVQDIFKANVTFVWYRLVSFGIDEYLVKSVNWSIYHLVVLRLREINHN
jgi:hypothetical protein